jgi:hypothetical protein
MALLRECCLRDGLGIEDEVLATQFGLDLHRSIAELASDQAISWPAKVLGHSWLVRLDRLKIVP